MPSPVGLEPTTNPVYKWVRLVGAVVFGGDRTRVRLRAVGAPDANTGALCFEARCV